MLLADNHFTPILGIDIHFTVLPPPIPNNPFQPFIGFVLDPMDYIPFIGATVNINGIKRGVSDTSGIIIPLAHIPILGVFVMAPIIGHEAMNFFASKTVFADGTRLSPKGHFLMTCNDIGIPLSLEPGKKKFWKIVPTLFAPTSYSIPIPMGPPVNVGGPYAPDWGGILTGLVMSFGFGAVMNFARKKMNKIIKKIAGDGNPFSKKLCDMGFEPVNLVNGAVIYEGTDFTLPGVIPVEWKRSWSSINNYEGILGHGCQSNYDLDITIVPEENGIAVRLEDGRVLGFSLISEGEEEYMRQEKLTLRRKKDSFEIFHHDEQRTYYYEQKDSSERYRLTKIENAAGFTLDFIYRYRELQQIKDTAGRSVYIDYTDNGLVESVWLNMPDKKKEVLVQYQYNEEKDMATITDALGKSTSIEYENHLMMKKTDRDRHTFYWEYENGQQGKSRCIHTWGDGGWQEGWIEYHPEKGYNIVKDCTKSETKYCYAPSQLVTQIEDPLGNIKRFEYTEYAELYREWDEENHVTGYTYDDNGNRTSIVHPDGTTGSFLYDDHGRLIMTVSPGGEKRLYVYRKDRNLLGSIIEPDNSITAFGYNENNLVSEIRHNGEAIQLEYDDKNNLMSLQDSKGLVTRWKYDYRNNVVGVENPAGGYQKFVYDALNRVTSIGSNGNVTQFRYNSYEEILEAKDNKRKVEFTYTPLGSLSTRKEDGIEIRFSYDRMERLRYLTNEHKEHYTFTRNLRGDIIKETGFDNMEREYLRDRSGKVVKVLRPDNRYTTYEYDLNGRIIHAEYSDGTWEDYMYDKNGRIIRCRNQNNCISFARDKMGRVVKETYSSGIAGDEGISVDSTYDENGNRIRITSSLGADIAQKYDYLGNVSEIEAINAENHETWTAQIKRNALGLEIEKTLTGNISISRSYDDFGRPMSMSVNQSRSSRQKETYSRRYMWNVNDQLMSVLNGISNGYVYYAYDAVGNLAHAEYDDDSFEYKMPDAMGNIYRNKDHSDREYGAGGRLLRDKEYNYFYDGEGNLTLKTRRKTPGIASLDYTPARRWGMEEDARYILPKKYTDEEKKALLIQWESERDNPIWKRGDYAYFWQANGMLKEVKTSEGKIVSFEYDALGRRTAKLCGDKINRYLWDGNVLLHEWSFDAIDRPKPVVDELGVPRIEAVEPMTNVVTWVYEDGSFVPSAKLVNNERYSIVSDYLGRPVQAYDEVGQIVWQTDYDIYGGLRNLIGGREFIPFRQLGQYEDEETGLYYNRFRYYDSSTGNYISKDPLSVIGGLNVYSYVSDTNIEVDLLGLSGQFTIYSDSPKGDPIGHAFISITENGTTEYIGQWPDPGFSGKKDILKITFSDMQGALDYDDVSHLNSPDLVSKTYDIDDARMVDLRKYIDEFASKNGSGNGYNLRNRQCASFAYGAAQSAGIDELKIPWNKKNILFGVTPSNLADKIKSLNECK